MSHLVCTLFSTSIIYSGCLIAELHICVRYIYCETTYNKCMRIEITPSFSSVFPKSALALKKTICMLFVKPKVLQPFAHSIKRFFYFCFFLLPNLIFIGLLGLIDKLDKCAMVPKKSKTFTK